jgi:hypothetical protein
VQDEFGRHPSLSVNYAGLWVTHTLKSWNPVFHLDYASLLEDRLHITL